MKGVCKTSNETLIRHYYCGEVNKYLVSISSLHETCHVQHKNCDELQAWYTNIWNFWQLLEIRQFRCWEKFLTEFSNFCKNKNPQIFWQGIERKKFLTYVSHTFTTVTTTNLVDNTHHYTRLGNSIHALYPWSWRQTLSDVNLRMHYVNVSLVLLQNMSFTKLKVNCCPNMYFKK